MRCLLRISLIALLFFSWQARATHIVGGDFTYRWVGGNNFEFTLHLYRDCMSGQANLDNSLVIGVFDKVTNQRVDTLYIQRKSAAFVTLSGPSATCVIPPQVCVEIGTYVDTLALPDNPHGYYAIWERCCRNASVVNIYNALSTGIAYYLEMPDPALHNSGPHFVNDPLPFVCENQPLNYSFAATDQDGDVLVYELSNPLAGNIGFPTNPPTAILPSPLPGPYASIVWEAGFSLANVCGSTVNPLSINASTGAVSVTVDYQGMYAMAVTVKEFRNGVQIGLMRREIEFSVIPCLASNPMLTVSTPGIANAGNSFSIYETDTLCMTITAVDPDDSLWLSFSGEIFAGGSINPPYATANNDSGFHMAQSDFCWKTACGQVRSTPYKVIYKATDNGCPLPFTVTDTISILIKPAPVDSSLNIICIGLRENLNTELFFESSTLTPSRYFDHYTVYRSKNGSPFAAIGTINYADSLTFKDLTATDYLNNDYCYCIRATNRCGITGPPSDTVCTSSQFNNSMNVIRQVSVIHDQEVELTWKHFPDAPWSTFYIYKKENNSTAAYELAETLVHPQGDSWNDDDVLVHNHSYCYYLVNEDYCGNISPASTEACTILLEGNSGTFENFLNWNSYTGWSSTARNEIYRKPVAASAYALHDFLSPDKTRYRDSELDFNEGRFNYYIKSVEDTGSLGGISISNSIELDQLPMGFIPAAFSPNGDGRNDTWGLHAAFVESASIRIFNRWGSLLVESNDKNFKWDGMLEGKPAPAGVYVYAISFKGYGSESLQTGHGTLTLIR